MSQFRKLFGSYNLGQMIETSYLSVSAVFVADKDNRGHESPPPATSIAKPLETLVGFAILSDNPRSGLSEDWLAWFSETHAPVDAEVTMTNTLWVDFAVALGTQATAGRLGEHRDDGYEQEEEAAGVIENIVRTVFNTLPEVNALRICVKRRYFVALVV